MIRVVLNKAIGCTEAPLNIHAPEGARVALNTQAEFLKLHEVLGKSGYKGRSDVDKKRIKEILDSVKKTGDPPPEPPKKKSGFRSVSKSFRKAGPQYE